MAKFTAQRLVTTFILRLLICLLIFGSFYLIYKNYIHKQRIIPLTPVQKVDKIRSDLDQTYFTTNQIANFHDYSTAGSYNLSNNIAQFNGDLTNLQTAFATAPSLISVSDKSNISQIINIEEQVKNEYLQASKVLVNVINYDPSSDLSFSLIPSNMQELSTRLTAAINGLSTAGNSTAPLSLSGALSVQSNDGNVVVSADAKKSILNE